MPGFIVVRLGKSQCLGPSRSSVRGHEADVFGLVGCRVDTFLELPSRQRVLEKWRRGPSCVEIKQVYTRMHVDFGLAKARF